MGTALAGLPQRMASLRESQASRAAPDSARSGATAGGSRAHDGDGPLDPLPGSSPGTSRELSMSSSSSGEGAPLPEGVQFTGDLEDDLAMLEVGCSVLYLDTAACADPCCVRPKCRGFPVDMRL